MPLNQSIWLSPRSFISENHDLLFLTVCLPERKIQAAIEMDTVVGIIDVYVSTTASGPRSIKFDITHDADPPMELSGEFDRSSANPPPANQSFQNLPLTWTEH